MCTASNLIGVILFGFVVGVCFMGCLGFSLMYKAGQQEERARKEREARAAWFRG